MFYSLPVETWIEAASALLGELQAEGERRTGNEEHGLEARATQTHGLEARATQTHGPEARATQAKAAAGLSRPRLLLVGAPIIWPNWWLPLMLEEAGGRIVADALCSSHRGFSDLVSVDETARSELIRALADRYFLPCSCPCFTPNEEYLWRIENQARDFRVDAAVIHRLKSCYVFDVEAKRLEQTFRRLDLPHLTVESDYEAPTTGALQTRVEAFVDLVRERMGKNGDR
jgi:benzoyl-CoA reductase/2-hydroxyglutaryl-CoA dehydratase subunit BcrC/BadD/HgdB